MNEAESYIKVKWQDKGFTMLRNGWPDFFAVRKATSNGGPQGELVAVEVKKPGEELSAGQEEVRRLLAEVGVPYVIERPTEKEVASRMEKDDAVPAETAIFDPDAPKRILTAARDTFEWGCAWCCLRLGMHPSNILKLRPTDLSENGVLVWRRVKNQKPMRVLLGPEEVTRVKEFINLVSRHPVTRVTIWQRVTGLVREAGYVGGPRVLRKTFILNELRDNWGRPDIFELVAQRAGCTKAILYQHYLDLEQWQKAYGGPREGGEAPVAALQK